MNENLTKNPDIYTFARKNARILHYVCPKNIFQGFFFWGGANFPLSQTPTSVFRTIVFICFFIIEFTAAYLFCVTKHGINGLQCHGNLSSKIAAAAVFCF